MAEQKLATDPAAAQALLAEARRGAQEALEELRDLARGIHPPVLADRGLEAAISALADRTPLAGRPSAVDLPRAPAAGGRDGGLLRRRRGARERRQARAGADTVDDRACAASGDALVVAGHRRRRTAAPIPDGSGLRGLRRRVEALDGTLVVDEPGRRADDDPGGDSVRVVIAEDLALLRDGLTRLLRDNGFEVVAAVAGRATRSCTRVLLERPDIAIVDIRLPPTFRDEGVRAALELRRARAGDGDPDRVAVRRAGLRRRAARRRARRRRLPAQGPDHGRRRLRRRRAPRRGRAGRRSTPRSSRSCVARRRRRAARRPHAARARGARR